MQNSFTEKVLKIISEIKKGDTKSYKQIAIEAGSPKAFRVVGTICKNNKDTKIPCHRVIKSNGKMGDYNGIANGKKGENSKKEILESEGFLVE
jgi:methylated-DNA-[protein]-cysteine S-methyltransferase